MNKAIITVVGQDTVGIIARVCTYLSDHKVNVLDISQTIIDGFFNMMMIVDYSGADNEFGVIVEDLDKLGEQIGVRIRCQREEMLHEDAPRLSSRKERIMLNIMEVRETNQMIEQEKLDVRTITMGISPA